MLITHDYSYTNKTLIENGYASTGIHSLNFDRYFTDEEMEENRQAAQRLNSQEWTEYWDKHGQKTCEQMKGIMEVLSVKYSIYQYNPQVKYGEHDLFFWSNKGWNGKDWYDCVQLSFNNELSEDRNNEILNELLDLLSNMEFNNITCRVQYKTLRDDEKLYADAAKQYDEFKGKFVNYGSRIGKVKEVGEFNGRKEYGFFKKGARKVFYHLTNEEMIFAINIYNGNGGK